jgi:pheromone shutdown-related protein TraB
MDENITRVPLGKREIILVGTAHVSRESVNEVRETIGTEKPDRVCIELDESRYNALTKEDAWKNLNIIKVLRERKGFLLFSNLILSSFQRRLGMDLKMKPGMEMLEAIRASERNHIPFSLCDREIQITLKRAWKKTSFWGKNKMLAAMLASMFTREKLSEDQIEELKKKGALQGMLEELAQFLPSVKEVLIDERDVYLATNIYKAQGDKIVAVVGAGHIPGIVHRLEELEKGNASDDTSDLNHIPPKSTVAKIIPWILPAAIIGAIVAGFILRGSDVTLQNIYKWVLFNGSLAALGAVASLSHPFTIVLAFVAAPFTSLVPVVGVGIFTGILEAALRKPKVVDFENLHEDITSFRGFFKNRITHILIVFFLTNIGSTIGTFIGGIPLFTSLFG